MPMVDDRNWASYGGASSCRPIVPSGNATCSPTRKPPADCWWHARRRTEPGSCRRSGRPVMPRLRSSATPRRAEAPSGSRLEPRTRLRGPVLGQRLVLLHPAPIDPVFPIPEDGALRRPVAARADDVRVAGRDQRQEFALRLERQRRLASERPGAGSPPAAGPGAPRTRRPSVADARGSMQRPRRQTHADRPASAGSRRSR